MNKKIQALMDSPSYRLAYQDDDFLRRENMRGTRLQLEYNKIEMSLRDLNINNTIVLFGSARTQPGHKHFEAARELAALITKKTHENTVVCSGGGPGIMEAANLGAEEAGGMSMGLNIELPHEQHPNPYITPELCFNFHYFAIRKMHFLSRARALIAFPGGFGTMDELFETLTLVQTGRMPALPIVLFDETWWRKIINFEAFIEAGTISPEDLDLFVYAETAEEAWQKIKNHNKFTLR